jgi:hypothetical protein
MEFFLPGIATLLIAALIVFLILPRLGAPVLAVLSLLLLVYGVYNHIQLFSSEYRYSTWQERLKDYSPFIIIGTMVVFIIGYITVLFSTNGANSLPANAVPMNSAVNEIVNNTQKIFNTNMITEPLSNVTNTITSGVNTVANTVSNAVTNVFGGNKGNGQGNRGALTNLVNILATPKNRNVY